MAVLAHLSDLHLDGGVRAHARAARVLSYLDGLPGPIDALLVSGDLTDHGTDDEYREFRDLFGGRSPLLVLPGNHDVRDPFRRVLLGDAGGDAPIDAVHDVAGVRFVTCDSTIPGHSEGRLADATCDWLAAVLAEQPERPTLVAFHHPSAALDSPPLDAIHQRDTARLEAIVAANPQVLGLLCGHAHTASTTLVAGRPLLVAPGVTSGLRLPWEGGPVLDPDLPPGLAFHVVDDTRLSTHYRVLPTD
ncbi:MAG: metallophosphoesterase [Pseudonocardia sp. SCN 72-86]|nr:MAG: metallophosphoesterase [Pseudonocardia sp. SCN 72-86]